MVDFFSRPMSSGPRDFAVAKDELGRNIYQTVTGDRYFINPMQETARERLRVEDVYPGANPYERLRNAAGGLARGAWEGAVDMFQTPGRAARGEPVSYGDVYGVAGGVGLGGMATSSAPKGSLGMFAGRRARGADLDAMARAEEMLDAGIDRAKVWEETGWFRGSDGQMRFEIDDSASSLGIGVGDSIREGQTLTGSPFEVIRHEALRDAYPDADGKMTVGLAMREKGEYDPRTGNMLALGPNDEGVRATALHEMQHGIQQYEGFAPGASVSSFSDRAEDVLRQQTDQRIVKLQERMTEANLDGDMDLYNRLESEFDQLVEFRNTELEDPYNKYARSAGEVEARNVEYRRDMTPEERRANPPWKTQEFADEDQILTLGAQANPLSKYLSRFGL